MSNVGWTFVRVCVSPTDRKAAELCEKMRLNHERPGSSAMPASNWPQANGATKAISSAAPIC